MRIVLGITESEELGLDLSKPAVFFSPWPFDGPIRLYCYWMRDDGSLDSAIQERMLGASNVLAVATDGKPVILAKETLDMLRSKVAVPKVVGWVE